MDLSKLETTITRSAVQAALKADQGQDAKLDTWENVLFTSSGDNYCSLVVSIKVKFSKEEKECQTSYIVKINPCHTLMGCIENKDFAPFMFQNEGKFYMEILPELNKLMAENNQKTLHFPKCYYANYEQNKEMIILEDLRTRNFKMTDRRKGMDLQHATVVIHGLSLLHAASSVWFKRNSMEDLKTRYPFLFNELWEGKLVDTLITPNLKSANDMLTKVGGQENAVAWVEKQIPEINDFLKRSYSNCPPFNAICHGDCWANNLLFSYNDEGSPIDVMFLDLQINRVASLATDLNHFLFCSMEGPVRKPNVDSFLTEYYETFSSVMEACGQEQPFTKDELVQEYRNKNGYGLLFGMLYVPPLVVDPGHSDGLDMYKMESQQDNPSFKPRFVDMFDEMEEKGLFA